MESLASFKESKRESLWDFDWDSLVSSFDKYGVVLVKLSLLSWYQSVIIHWPVQAIFVKRIKRDVVASQQNAYQDLGIFRLSPISIYPCPFPLLALETQDDNHRDHVQQVLQELLSHLPLLFSFDRFHLPDWGGVSWLSETTAEWEYLWKEDRLLSFIQSPHEG